MIKIILLTIFIYHALSQVSVCSNGNCCTANNCPGGYSCGICCQSSNAHCSCTGGSSKNAGYCLCNNNLNIYINTTITNISCNTGICCETNGCPGGYDCSICCNSGSSYCGCTGGSSKTTGYCHC